MYPLARQAGSGKSLCTRLGSSPESMETAVQQDRLDPALSCLQICGDFYPLKAFGFQKQWK
jgi:hypothetical protein